MTRCYVESNGGSCQYGGELYNFDAGLVEAIPRGMDGSEPDYFERSRDLAIHACGKIGGQYREQLDIPSVTVGASLPPPEPLAAPANVVGFGRRRKAKEN